MYCKRCGRELKDKAKFCPRCGTAILRPRKKKKTGKIVALTLSGLILLGACSGVFVYRDTLMAWLEGDRVYTEADEIIQDAIVCESFQQADFEGRKEIAEKTLKQMEADKKIQSKSVSYSDDGYYYFHFKNGADGIISLLDQNKTLDGASPFYSEDNQSKTYKVGDIDRIPDFSEKNIKQPYEENDKTALIIDQLEYEFNSKNFEEDSKEWSKCHLKTTYKSDVTAGKMKTLLHGYDFIDIRCHGQMDTSINKNFATPAIVLNEKFENPAKKGYLLDLKEGRIAALYSWDAGQYILNPKFFTYYYQFKKLDNPIVWIGCCNGFKNDKLVKAFSKIGASAVIGATESVNTLYGTEMCDEFVYQLMLGKDTVIALNKAKEVWGENDGGSPPAEFKIYNDGSAEIITLFTLTDFTKKLISGDVSEGAISGKVVDVDGNTVVGATVIIESSSNDTSVETNQQGEFQVSCSPGDYTINVIADGYETYTSPDTIEVKSEGVTYVDWIELIPDEITKLVNTVIENTSIWQTNIENEDNYYSMSNGKIAGDDWIWFQDIDMDGTLEFLTMTKYLDYGSGVDRRSFNVYECDGGFSTYREVNSDLGSSGEFSVANNQMETDTFNYTLWQKSDGNYVYLTVSSMDTLLGELSYLEFDDNSCVNFPIISICSNGEGCNINWTSFESPEFSDTVSYDKAVEYYNSYFSDMVGYQTVTKKIKLSDYISQSDEEKKALLLDSAKSWNYSKDENAVKPMQDVINEASKMAADNMNYDYKQAYHNVVKSMSSGKNLFFYTLFDMNHDNIPELIIVSGTCEADAILTFYSYIDGDAVVVGDNFSGFHASFCIDVDNDQFCVQWGQMGMGGIEWYSFDGKIVTQTKTQENIDYATSQYSNDDFNNYGNFKDCEYDPQF